MARRWLPSPILRDQGGSVRTMTVPESSGPRWARERVARTKSSGARDVLRATMPTMPHTRLVSQDITGVRCHQINQGESDSFHGSSSEEALESYASLRPWLVYAGN